MAQMMGADGVFTHKLGPLPTWQWIGIAAVPLIGWRLYESHKTKGAGSTASTGASTSTGTTNYGASAETGASQVPQFVNQTYLTNVAPPSAPAPAPAVAATPAPAAAAPVAIFPPPTALTASKPSASGVTLTWTIVPSGATYPTSYTVAVYNAKGTLVQESTVAAPDSTGGKSTTTLGGLPAKTTLHANVWPNGGQKAPQHATTTFTTT
jgi:hypothetical protein